jgi:hypothetical protein
MTNRSSRVIPVPRVDVCASVVVVIESPLCFFPWRPVGVQ